MGIFRRNRIRHAGRMPLEFDGQSATAGVYQTRPEAISIGHDVFDPHSDCPVHSRRPEPFCEIEQLAAARDEIANHSYLGCDYDELFGRRSR